MGAWYDPEVPAGFQDADIEQIEHAARGATCTNCDGHGVIYPDPSNLEEVCTVCNGTGGAE